jgi:UDP-3-O-[3-hydroxymyristoyl] glucosamine N-acyltransferase
MADSNFFSRESPYSLAHISAKIGADLLNPEDADFIVSDVATLSEASSDHIAFLDNKKYRSQFSETKAGAVIVHPDMVSYAPAYARLLISKTPYKSYALAAQLFYPEDKPVAGISEFARIHSTAKIGPNVSIGDFVTIGANVEIGMNSWIESHVSIQDGVKIGQNCRVGCHTSISHAIIGNFVRLYVGTRIGQDGFGFAIDPAGFVKVPQLGRVILGDHIEIGANSCIDRGSQGDTIIGAGTWIDNLVQIGHNVKMGRGCILASQVGIAGSTELGDFVVLGGQVGVAGHLHIGSLAKVAAKSGVTKNIPPKEEWMGYPALPMKRFLRQTVKLGQLIDKNKEN